MLLEAEGVGDAPQPSFLDLPPGTSADATGPPTPPRQPEDPAAVSTSQQAPLEVPVVDYSTPVGAAQLAELIKSRWGRVRAAVVAAGAMPPFGTMTGLELDDTRRVLEERVLSQVLLAKTLLPLVDDTYTIVTGRLGECCTWDKTALLTVANAALYGVVSALQEEYASGRPRVIELRIGGVVRRDWEAGHPDLPGTQAYPASLVGKAAVRIARNQTGRHGQVRLNLDQPTSRQASGSIPSRQASGSI